MIDLLHPRTWAMLGVGLILAAFAFRSLRDGRLKERYVLLFLLTSVPFLVLAVWPDAIGLLARDVLRIEYGTLLTMLVTVYFLVTTFSLLSIVSVQDRKLTRLAQDVALLQQRLDEQRGAGEPRGE